MSNRANLYDAGAPMNDEQDWIEEEGSDDEGESEDNEDDEDWEEEEGDDDDDDDDGVRGGGGKDLLWLCREGLLERALDRVKRWEERIRDCDEKGYRGGDGERGRGRGRGGCGCGDGGRVEPCIRERVRREILRTGSGRDGGGTALHEILMGGTNNLVSRDLVRRLVDLCGRCDDDGDNPATFRRVFASTPGGGGYGRTLLHWAAWGGADPETLRIVVRPHPEAMFVRDDRDHGRRTPLQIAERYWPHGDGTALLRRFEVAYGHVRIRRAFHLCVRRMFLLPPKDESSCNDVEGGDDDEQSSSSPHVPMDKSDRRKAGVSPRPWFAASVVGYLLQREMVGLAHLVLSFMGTRTRSKKKNSGGGGRGKTSRREKGTKGNHDVSSAKRRRTETS